MKSLPRTTLLQFTLNLLHLIGVDPTRQNTFSRIRYCMGILIFINFIIMCSIETVRNYVNIESLGMGELIPAVFMVRR